MKSAPGHQSRRLRTQKPWGASCRARCSSRSAGPPLPSAWSRWTHSCLRCPSLEPVELEDVSAVCVSVGGTLRWVCLTYPDPTLLSKPAAKRDKTAGLGRLLPSTVLSPYKKNFSKSGLWWNHIWNRLSTYISSRQRILTHRNSHVLTSLRWQHCFVFYNLECVARDTLCNSDLSQWKAQLILKCVLQMQIVFVLQIQIRSLSSAIHICPAEIPEACATIRKSDNIPATLICNI